jgi:dynein assembly factor 5
MFSTVTGSSSQIAVTTSPNWDPHSPAKAAFDVLVGQCPLEAWRCHLAVVSVITLQVQPKTGPAANSAEANALSYAAQRGEELIALTTDVDVRLSLLALLEGYIRGGAADWECSPHMAVASEKVIKEVLLPNLIWRVGKVEATIRKVALATAYALLRAGGVTYETLFRVAPELVPLLVGNLDDQELTPRLITCLCLTVIFERLRGAFGEQSVREIYPKLLARLDDSADTVRIAICGTMTMFLQSAPPACYSGTTIDYTLDQLFIHLDDPDPAVQNAVFAVIVTAAELDKAVVLKKANANRANHRSPLLCDRLVVEVQGFEILED